MYKRQDMVYKLLTEDYGNPSSLHMKGVEAENYINDAKKKIAKTLRVQAVSYTHLRRVRILRFTPAERQIY